MQWCNKDMLLGCSYKVQCYMQANARLLSKLHETERGQTLSYQVCQLLESLSQLNEADSKVMTKK